MNAENTAPPSFATLMRHAAIAGSLAAAGAFIWLLIEYALGFHGERLAQLQYMQMVGLAFPIAAIALGIMRWRDRVLDGRIRFSQAFGVGLAIGLFFAIDYAIFNWIYAAVINPGFIERIIEFQAQAMLEAGSTQEEVETAIEAARAHATAGSYGMAVAVQMLVASLIIALFAAVIVRRR
ncbi:MAG: DUF4199 domain-containing protein, partial [Verrucomicrobia bacterium]